MPNVVDNDVYAGHLDYRRGVGWVCEPGKKNWADIRRRESDEDMRGG